MSTQPQPPPQLTAPGPLVGQAANRITGPARVTGRARYAGETMPANTAYGVFVLSTIAKGEMTALDTRAAEAVPGVVGVMSHRNLPPVGPLRSRANGGGGGTVLLPMRDTRIHYAGQPVALVVADTLENATYAAALVRPQYRAEAANTELAKGKPRAKPAGDPLTRGNVAPALAAAPVKLDLTYRIPIEHHNPIEPSGTLAIWQTGNRLTVHEPSQWVTGLQQYLSQYFDLPAENVHVVAPYIGGGFGCKAFPWPHTLLTVAAARLFRRPLKCLNTREHEYTAHGYRAEIEQRYQLGADAQGKLLALQADLHFITSETDDWESIGTVEFPATLFSCPNVRAQARAVPLDYGMPTSTRGPGWSEGSFAMLSAMDELAAHLKRDPLELHLLNYAERDEDKNLPWSSKELRACYAAGAARFGWDKRPLAPGTLKDGHLRVGWGMAACLYPVHISPAEAKVRLYADGRVLVQSGVQDLGTGTHTVMAQLAADTLGVPLGRVAVEVGDSALPTGPVAGGSRTTASVLPAVQATGRNLISQFVALAIKDETSPLNGLKKEQVVLREGRLVSTADAGKSDSYTELLQRRQAPYLDAYDEYVPAGMGPLERSQFRSGSSPRVGPEISGHMSYAYGAVFVEVKVDPFIGTLHVTRVVAAYDAGRIINQKTAESQLRGGIVWGIGMACTEATITDHRLSRFVNNNLADYHLPVQADVPLIDVQFVPCEDAIIGPLGSKGVGELGVVGVAAAICNAVYHATGKRIRELPITPEKLLV